MHGLIVRTIFITVWLVFFVSPASARIADGLPCGDCHTMHNSQDNISMSGTGVGPSAGLLNSTCIGCHTGTNSAGNAYPFVLDTSGAPTSTSLAGGNFYWVGPGGSDPKGHNVLGISAFQTLTPPGGSPLASQLTCAGANGCHGDTSEPSEFRAMFGAHHDKSGLDDAGYRFLLGIAGLEDADWEFTASSNDHNQYKASSTAGTPGTDTITAVCVRCHGDFHSGGTSGTSSPWLRHPVSVDISSYGGEFTGYTTYQVEVPVASTGASVVVDNTVQNAGNGVITCITCHRAHGSANDSILRWDYKSWPAGGYGGCQVCHSSKD
jgi:cytochrome c553